MVHDLDARAQQHGWQPPWLGEALQPRRAQCFRVQLAVLQQPRLQLGSAPVHADNEHATAAALAW